MLLHISDELSVKKKDVLFILDYRLLKNESTVLELLKNSTVKKLKKSEEKFIKSIVITRSGKNTNVFFSPCASLTLARRVNNDKQSKRTTL